VDKQISAVHSNATIQSGEQRGKFRAERFLAGQIFAFIV
jgi:hypothetical protein